MNNAGKSSTPLMFDTPYSWIVLLGVIVCNFTSVGVLFGSAGIFSAEYPLLLNTEKKHTNIISSVTTGVFLFSGKTFCRVLLHGERVCIRFRVDKRKLEMFPYHSEKKEAIF